MARKVGLNRKEQIQCAKWLTEGVPARDIAKKFKTSPEVVAKFTQKALDEAHKRAADRAAQQGKIAQKQATKAAILKKAIELNEEGDFS